ncbi:MAG TPA: pyridoxal phosphate-dependent aminotransferase [Thermoanaerobaculia bacterium]|nr:pyridoxal phosphate-dependent aminotransferase [Thermoanaerobaculia bacterium]
MIERTALTDPEVERASSSGATTPATIPGFRPVPRTGVIFVMHRAARRGYGTDGELWCNLGQGSPEVGPLPGAPPRRESVELPVALHAYAPVEGLRELRARVADFYNTLYRRGLPSQYTVENVCIAPGGRAALSRLAAAMAPINLGHFIPDYTAYEELLFAFRGFIPIPILLDASAGYRISAADLRDEIVGRGLGGLLFSNPANPTGQVVEGAELADWVEVARSTRCAFVLDEFYSHYVYTPAPQQPSQTAESARLVSAAAWVEDVDRDPVVVVDGLTKNWRYPGWRVSWILGPRSVIEQASSAGSFLDGGANHPFQRAAIELLEPTLALSETAAIRTEFSRKRRYLIDRLRSLGVGVEVEPAGTFYVWGNLDALPEPLRDGMAFFDACLDERVITVPGVFFDVNPGRRRANARFTTYSRFSFGAEQAQLEKGLDAVERVIARHR